jgi:hypothetical protein
MRIEQSYYQKSKALFHAAQALFTFVAGCLALAILTKSGNHGGQVGFYFALVSFHVKSSRRTMRCSPPTNPPQCFLSVPALIYQVMVPMWTRAWRFANIYAYLALDLLFALLWFAATIALGVWQSQGIKQGAQDHKDDADAAKESECELWAWGNVSKCKVTKAAVGFGVVIFLLWVLTSAISVWMMNKYKKTGVVPGSKNGGRGAFQPQVDDPASKDAWSTRIDEPDDNMYGHGRPSQGEDEHDEGRKYGQVPDYDEHDNGRNNGMLRSDSQNSGFDAHPGRRSPMNADALSLAPTSGYEDGMAPSALSPTGVLSPTGYGQINPFANPNTAYESQTGGRVNFPAGNY